MVDDVDAIAVPNDNKVDDGGGTGAGTFGVGFSNFGASFISITNVLPHSWHRTSENKRIQVLEINRKSNNK